MISYNLDRFDQKPVADFDPGLGIADPLNTSYRVRAEYEDEIPFQDRLAKFLSDPNISKVNSLVIGAWSIEGESSESVVEMLTAASDDLKLEALFLGDIVSEEQEISWIEHGDISPLFLAFPDLRILRVRGSNSLQVGTIRHEKLEQLAFESGGLPSSVWLQVVQADLPSLEKLELWFGEDNYGFDGDVADLAGLNDETRFPKLKELGLMNSMVQNDIAKWIVQQPILARLERLDMSMGALTDEGAKALAESKAFSELSSFKIHYHFVSDEGLELLGKTGVSIDAAEQEEADEDDGEVYYYIGVSE
ncbi:MAG: STM4015 family protein [Planctomycetota bacterium]